MKRTYDIVIDISNVFGSPSFEMFVGDSVEFNFTFQDGGEALDISDASQLRVYAKRIGPDGFPVATDNPLFDGLFNNQSLNSAYFPSEDTMGNSGKYALVVILSDAQSNQITRGMVYFDLINNGYLIDGGGYE